MSAAVKVVYSALEDAEQEILKLRRLLVVKLCDCRRISLCLPLEPTQHRVNCNYRRELL